MFIPILLRGFMMASKDASMSQSMRYIFLLLTLYRMVKAAKEGYDKGMYEASIAGCARKSHFPENAFQDYASGRPMRKMRNIDV